MSEFTYTITAEDKDLAIKQILRQRFQFSARMRNKIKREKLVYLNGEQIPGWITAKPGDVLEIRLPEETSDFIPEDIPIRTVYEDSSLLSINKQPGIVVHPTKGHPQHTLANGIMKEMLDRGQSFKIRFMNRLDMDTSGLLVVAKNAYCQNDYTRQMKENLVEKRYIAIVCGIVSSDSDFTRLAARLRESRMFVIGMGESKTPTAFKSACDTFKYLDVLMGMKKETLPVAVSEKASKQPAQQPKAAKKQAQPAQPKKAAGKKGQKPEPEKEPEPVPAAPAEPHHDEELAAAFVSLDEIVAKIREIVEHDSDEDGYMPLSQVGVMLSRIYADFDSRNYGFSKLHKLIDYTKAFETKYEQFENGGKNLVIPSQFR